MIKIFFLKKNKFSTNAYISSTQKDIFLKYKQHALSQNSIKLVESLKPPVGNYQHMSYSEKKKKFNIYMYNLKLKLYFYNHKNTKLLDSNYNTNCSTNKNSFFLLKSTQKEIIKIFKKDNSLENMDISLLCKYLLFYFSFSLPKSWYCQPKILRYIKRLYFFETGYRYNSKLSYVTTKNIYSHSLFNNILRVILLEKKLSKNLNNNIQPFLKKLKVILSLYNTSKQKIDNFEIIFEFFTDLLSSEFLKDNYIFLKEFEIELVNIIDKEFKHELKDNKNKIKIFLINFFIKDFILFLKEKNNFKYINYDKKIFNIKRNPHSFFLIPK